MDKNISQNQDRWIRTGRGELNSKSMDTGFFRILLTYWDNPDLLKKSTYAVGLLLILVSISFSLFYISDRYIHKDDQPLVEQGIEHYEALAQENPQDIDLRISLASLYLERGKYKDAIEQSSQVLSISPENESALYIKGLANTQLGDSALALDPLTRYVDLRKDSPYAMEDNLLETALYNIGINYIRLDEPEKSIKPLLGALNIQPTNADVLFSLGFAYQQLEENSEAIAAYETALFYVPDYREAYQQLYTLYTEESSELRKYSQGAIAYCEGDYPIAQEYLLASVSNQPEHAPSHAMLGMVYEKMGEYESAIIEYQTAVSLQPDYFLAEHSLERVKKIISTTNVTQPIKE